MKRRAWALLALFGAAFCLGCAAPEEKSRTKENAGKAFQNLDREEQNKAP